MHTPPLHTLAMASLAHAGDGSDDDLNNEVPPATLRNASVSSEGVISARELADDSEDDVVCGSTFVSYKSRCSLCPSAGPIFHRR